VGGDECWKKDNEIVCSGASVNTLGGNVRNMLVCSCEEVKQMEHIGVEDAAERG
jgi:hypothetical protein